MSNSLANRTEITRFTVIKMTKTPSQIWQTDGLPEDSKSSGFWKTIKSQRERKWVRHSLNQYLSEMFFSFYWDKTISYTFLAGRNPAGNVFRNGFPAELRPRARIQNAGQGGTEGKASAPWAAPGGAGGGSGGSGGSRKGLFVPLCPFGLEVSDLRIWTQT